jgi:hypothetical protein
MAPRAEHFLTCPHCGFLISITGAGAKTVVKGTKPVIPKPPPAITTPPKPGLHDVLREHFDPYFRVANLFGKKKNFAPMLSATAYMGHITAGATDERIFKEADGYVRMTNPEYLKQFVNWLNVQDFTIIPPEGAKDAASTDRFSNRRQAD